MHSRLLALFLACLYIRANEAGRSAESSNISCQDKLKELEARVNDIEKPPRYLLYEVNRAEGFNLRRDVYMRMAETVRMLRSTGENFILVLPPWNTMTHWSPKESTTSFPWSDFFDIRSLYMHVPVIEMDQFIYDRKDEILDQVVWLQHYNLDSNKEFKMRWQLDDEICPHEVPVKYNYRQDVNMQKEQKPLFWDGFFYGMSNMKAKHLTCATIFGDSSTLARMILEEFYGADALFLDRAETIIHKNYGEKQYWRARRSMRYNEDLIRAGNKFRKDRLNSDDEKDNTHLETNWQRDKPRRDATGGPYVCVHWRRRDFLISRSDQVPSVKSSAAQLRKLAVEYGLSTIFLATDAQDFEVEKLEKELGRDLKLVRFGETAEERLPYADGQLGILDQWICAHARVFIGTHESTFSFRIQEDREILGFDEQTTFNRLCKEEETTCEQPSKWKIVY